LLYNIEHSSDRNYDGADFNACIVIYHAGCLIMTS